MTDWREDKKWSDKFIPQIKRILGEHLIAEGNWRQDAKEGSDLLIFECNPFRVACRVRRNRYLDGYAEDFTIRCDRARGETEMAKIMSGWGDFIFYGFEGQSGDTVVNWFIGDLKVFRLAIWRKKDLLTGSKKSNGDGSSDFYAWKRGQFPPEFIKAQGDTVSELCPTA